MKRKVLLIISIIILSVATGLMILHIWIGISVRHNIDMIRESYKGTTEEALISYLLDEENHCHDRTHIAIWTLGQIRSEKALPVLHDLYQDDPKGHTCYGNHDGMLCQYEIHKAILAIEKKKLFTHARLRFYSKQDFRDWYESDDYQAILNYRLKAEACDTVLVEGLPRKKRFHTN